MDKDWLTKKLAVVGIFYTAMISIGASFLGAGISILYTVPPLIAQYSKMTDAKFEESIVNNLLQTSNYFIWGGIMIIVFSVISVIIIVYLPKAIHIKILHVQRVNNLEIKDTTLSSIDAMTVQESIRSGKTIVKNGITYNPDGTRVDSHGTIL